MKIASSNGRFFMDKMSIFGCMIRSFVSSSLAIGGGRWRAWLGRVQRNARTTSDAGRPRRTSFKASQILLRFIAGRAKCDGAQSEVWPTRTDGARRLGLTLNPFLTLYDFYRNLFYELDYIMLKNSVVLYMALSSFTYRIVFIRDAIPNVASVSVLCQCWTELLLSCVIITLLYFGYDFFFISKVDILYSLK